MKNPHFDELKSLIEWYFVNEKTHFHPTEAEVSNHLITPLLKLCGWSAKQLSYERHLEKIGRIDIGLHRHDNRKDIQDVIGFVEVKKYAHFNEKALTQAKTYSACLPNVTKFIVTDGYTYDIHTPAEKLQSLSIRDSSFEEVLRALSPESFI